MGIGNGISWGDVCPWLDDAHTGFVCVHTCVDVLLIGYIYVPPSSFDQLLASLFCGHAGRLDET